MKKNLLYAFVIALIIFPCIYLLVVYKRLPETVATHFGIDGKPDGFGSKTSFAVIIIFLSVFNAGMYLLMSNVHKIDPKKAAKLSKDTMEKIGLAVVILITSITIIIIYSALNNKFTLNKVMLPLLGLFFAYMGNMMHSVKPNYFVGIRTPWALEDAETWRKTHQLAGKLWFSGGIIIAVGALLLKPEYGLVLMFIIAAIITIIPVVFSYRYYQLHKNNFNQ